MSPIIQATTDTPLPKRNKSAAPKLIPVRCFSDLCLRSLSSQLYQYLDPKEQTCPLCNCSGSLKPLVVIHLLVEDQKGIIQGSTMYGKPKRRYAFACGDANKAMRSYPAHHKDFPRHYTNDPASVTCLDCLQEYGESLTGSMFDVHKRR